MLQPLTGVLIEHFQVYRYCVADYNSYGVRKTILSCIQCRVHWTRTPMKTIVKLGAATTTIWLALSNNPIVFKQLYIY